MRILQIQEKYLDIALDKSAFFEMIKSLTKNGHEIILLTGFKKKREYYGLQGNIRYLFSIKIKGLHFFTLKWSIFFYSFIMLRKWQPDVVLCCPFSVFPLVSINILSKIILKKVKFVMDIRSIPVEVNSLGDKIKEHLFNLSIVLVKNLFDGITVISPFMRKYVSKKYRLEEKIIGVWSSGASLEHFNPDRLSKERVTKIKRELNLDKKFVVMYHGVLTPNRGLQETISAMNLIKNSYKDIVFLMVGDGSAKRALQKLIADYQIDENVKLIGSVPYDDIPYYIELCNIGILPFPPLMWWRVSSPIKLMEYLAVGKPVIVTDIEAHREVLDSCKYAIFVPLNNPEDLASAISKACAKWGQLKYNFNFPESREMVKNHYTWDRQAEKLESYLSSLI